jgi:hypothetical protein
VNSPRLPKAALGRRGNNIEGQLTGAVVDSQSRPEADHSCICAGDPGCVLSLIKSESEGSHANLHLLRQNSTEQ